MRIAIWIVGAALVSGSAAAAPSRPLPAGGGDPGKAFLKEKCIPPNAGDPTDPKALEPILAAWLTEHGRMPSEKDVAKLQAERRRAVTRWEAIGEAMIAIRGGEFNLSQCAVLGGSSDGPRAILDVEALNIGLGAKMRCDVQMVQTAGKWTFKAVGDCKAPEN